MPNDMSPETVAVVKSTIPALEERYIDIAKAFYKKMFIKYPVTASFFNQDRVIPADAAAQGVPPQVAALGGSVLAYAKSIEDLTPIMPYIERVCHKHVSRNVRGPHYKLVGESLLEAMRSVLGPDVFTDEVYEAWKEAYGYLAQALIEIESRIRETGENDAAVGYSGYKEFKIVEIIEHKKEGPKSFRIVAAEGDKIPSHHGGQYLSFDFQYIPNLGRGKATAALSAVSENYLQFTVFPCNERPTNFLLNAFRTGDTLSVSIPCGPFRVSQEKLQDVDNVVIAGVGESTGMILAIANDVAAAGVKNVTLVVEKDYGDVVRDLNVGGAQVIECDEVGERSVQDAVSDTDPATTGVFLSANLKSMAKLFSNRLVEVIEV